MAPVGGDRISRWHPPQVHASQLRTRPRRHRHDHHEHGEQGEQGLGVARAEGQRYALMDLHDHQPWGFDVTGWQRQRGAGVDDRAVEIASDERRTRCRCGIGPYQVGHRRREGGDLGSQVQGQVESEGGVPDVVADRSAHDGPAALAAAARVNPGRMRPTQL